MIADRVLTHPATDTDPMSAMKACAAWLNERADDQTLGLNAGGYPPQDLDVDRPMHTCYITPTAEHGLITGHLLRD